MMMRRWSNGKFETFPAWLFKSLRSTFWHKAPGERTNHSTAELDKRQFWDKERCKAAGPHKTHKMFNESTLTSATLHTDITAGEPAECS